VTCIHPVSVEGRLLPCGQCVACKIQRTRQWTIRLLGELEYWADACFATLTYDDDHLPLNKYGVPTLYKFHLMGFIREVRRDWKIKYYACGEYGERTARPHYHAIIFGINPGETDYVLRQWRRGMIKLGSVTKDSCRYVAQYIDKKWNGKKAVEEYVKKELQPPFQLQSKGLGLKWLEDNIDEITYNDYQIRYNGHDVGLPRYFVKKIKQGGEEEAKRYDESADAKVKKSAAEKDEWLEKHGMSWLDSTMHTIGLRRQKAEEYRWKDDAYRRGKM